MPGDLRVSTTHVRGLSVKHRQAAAEIRSATAVTRGVDTSIRVSHGVIATSTAGAVEAAHHARDRAGTSMVRAADALGDILEAAAGRYDGTDRRTGGTLGLPAAHPRLHPMGSTS